MARVLILAAAAAFWVGLLEGAARLWISRRGDALDRSMSLLRADARLGWAQRENWRGEFEGWPLATNECGLRSPPLQQAGAASRRILILGPSSTMGWGVAEEKTYARRLESLLREHGEGDWAVVNAGEIGYSIWQGLAFYRDGPLRALRPEAVVMAYGANDGDVHRFFLDGPQTDAAALGPGRPALAVGLQNALRRLLCLHLGARFVLRALDRAGPRAPGAGVARVPLEEFKADVGELVRLARADGARPVLMTTPFRLPGGAPPEARRLEADLRRYNEAVRAVARAQGVALLDAERLLRDEPAAGLLDAVHPSEAGHDIIARGLAAMAEGSWERMTQGR